MKSMKKTVLLRNLQWIAAAVSLACVLSSCMPPEPERVEIPLDSVARDWDTPADWRVTCDGQTRCQLDQVQDSMGPCLKIDYALKKDGGWAQLAYPFTPPRDADRPITFLIKAPEATGALEIKFVDPKGSTFGVKFALHGQFKDWTRITAYFDDLAYWWGGDGEFDGLAEFHFAVSGTGSGVVLLDDVGFAEKDLPSSCTLSTTGSDTERWENGRYIIARGGPLLDPNRNKEGVGFEQRRSDVLIPENPLVLEWLKTLQDVSTPEQQVLPTSENNQLQTFNNSLVAQAFILKGERERAERILDYYAAAAVNRDNQDPTLQSFFYKGEARGFFQHCELKDSGDVKANHHNGTADRWTGDMAWLLFAYKFYEQEYGSDRYKEVTQLILDLLISWYRDDPNVPGGGYIDHGWRKGDAYLHEGFGHAEGNIDCYAVFRLFGEDELATEVYTWLSAVTRGNTQPLDVYTWQVLAYDGKRCELLDVPDFDLRYRKTVEVNGKKAVGPFSSADITVNNIWLDGLGHIACAYAACGNRERAYFYANQFDPMLMESHLGGKTTMTLPYTANTEGGYDFDQSKGIISVAAWYIFAKNGYNPMRLRRCWEDENLIAGRSN